MTSFRKISTAALLAVSALGLATAPANAAPCRDAKGHFTKCPAASHAVPAKSAAAKPAAAPAKVAAAKPAAKPAAKVATKPAAKVAAKPAAKPATKSAKPAAPAHKG